MKGVSMLNSKERGSLILKWIPLKLKYINKIFKKLKQKSIPLNLKIIKKFMLNYVKVI